MFNQGFGRQENNTAYSIVAEGDVVIYHKVDHYQHKDRKEGFVIYHDVVHYRLRYQTRGWGRGRGARGRVVVEP